MNGPEENFQSSLWREADAKSLGYEQALAQFYAIAEKREVEPGSDLLEAAQEVKENLRLYTGALRRIANFAAHQPSAI